MTAADPTAADMAAGLTAADPSPAAVLAALGAVYDPCSQAWHRPLSVRDLGLVRDVTVDGGHATVRVSLTTPFCTALATLMQAVEVRAGEVDGVTGVTVEIDVDTPWTPALMTEDGRTALAARRAADRARPATIRARSAGKGR